MKFGNWDYNRCCKAMPCPICGRPRYCMVSTDSQYAICTKVSEGALKVFAFGNLFRLTEQTKPKVVIKTVTTTPMTSLAIQKVYQGLEFGKVAVTELAKNLKVKTSALIDLGVGRSVGLEDIYYFPMYDADKELCGLKVRDLNHRKWCVSGSKLGIYMGRSFNAVQAVLVCEGESDTAAALSQGFNAVGRASATTCTAILKTVLTNKQIFVVADNDTSGLGYKEAVKLCGTLNPAMVVFNQKFKDIREWINSGTFSFDSFMENIVQ